MPEGDSVYQLARRLQVIVGREVLATSIRVPRYAVAKFDGTRCTKVWPYGKHLFMDFGEQSLHTHLKMEGVWSLHLQGQRWRRPGYTARVVLRFDGAPQASPIELVGHDLGLVRVEPTSSAPASIAHLGPDVLGSDWDAGGREEAKRRMLAHPERAVGLALLDQTVLAGVGNEYRAEICFLAGVHPAERVCQVDGDQVLDITRRLMWANRLSPVRVTTGVRKAGHTSYVFGRKGRPCRRCGTAIAQSTLVDDPTSELERIIWWCPRCQRLSPA